MKKGIELIKLQYKNKYRRTDKSKITNIGNKNRKDEEK